MIHFYPKTDSDKLWGRLKDEFKGKSFVIKEFKDPIEMKREFRDKLLNTLYEWHLEKLRIRREHHFDYFAPKVNAEKDELNHWVTREIQALFDQL